MLLSRILRLVHRVLHRIYISMQQADIKCNKSLHIGVKLGFLVKFI